MSDRSSRDYLRVPLLVHDGLTWISFITSSTALAVLTASYVYEVVARYFFGSPTSWSGDVVGYALCVSVFLALPMITAMGRHVSVTVVLDSVSRKSASYMYRAIDLLGLVACLAAAWFSFGENLRQFRADILTVANYPIPKWWITTVITFGLVMSAMYFLRRLFRRDNLKPAGPNGLDL